MANILVVDDSKVMRINIKNLLCRLGHEVIAEAANGSEAITAFELHKPDIVTMDITMPIMDGITTSKKILDSYPEARIIMISSLDHEEWVVDAIKNGARNYIVKPIQADKLKNAIIEILHQ